METEWEKNVISMRHKWAFLSTGHALSNTFATIEYIQDFADDRF